MQKIKKKKGTVISLLYGNFSPIYYNICEIP